MLGPLDPYTPSTQKPWNKERVAHLYRRLGYGASLAEINDVLNASPVVSPSQLVDQLLDSVLNAPAPVAPFWANYTSTDYNGDDVLIAQHENEFTNRWVSEQATDSIRSKITLFWHNHFVTEKEVYGCNSYMWSYYALLHQYGLGNFRTFVEEMGKTPAMLVYLNGNENVADEPNENYGRELLELFTLGENNGYTQDDIVEVARALTGWRCAMYECTAPYFDSNYYDSSPKTIFGQTGNWNYDDVHQLIFTVRSEQTAYNICSKIYRHFVYDEINEEVISGMMLTFQQNNFELAPVFRQLFKSEHFFESVLIGAHIKSPIESFMNVIKAAGLDIQEDFNSEFLGFMTYGCMELGQSFFNPVDVAGWPGYHDWLNENTLTTRWSFMSDLLFYFIQTSGKGKLLNLAIELTNNSNDPQLITQAIANHFLVRPLDTIQLESATQYFKGEIPQNYFDDGSWNLYWDEVPDQILNLLNYLARLPEFQLA